MSDCAEQMEIALLEQRLLGHEAYENLCVERGKVHQKYDQERLERDRLKWNALIRSYNRPTMILPDAEPGTVVAVESLGKKGLWARLFGGLKHG